jgi:hypothetical protein
MLLLLLPPNWRGVLHSAVRPACVGVNIGRVRGGACHVAGAEAVQGARSGSRSSRADAQAMAAAALTPSVGRAVFAVHRPGRNPRGQAAAEPFAGPLLLSRHRRLEDSDGFLLRKISVVPRAKAEVGMCFSERQMTAFVVVWADRASDELERRVRIASVCAEHSASTCQIAGRRRGRRPAQTARRVVLHRTVQLALRLSGRERQADAVAESFRSLAGSDHRADWHSASKGPRMQDGP